tara:strand:- start:240 stop:428 length:189 start_codon:yes stop_codon:yes gene_type:complete
LQEVLWQLLQHYYFLGFLLIFPLTRKLIFNNFSKKFKKENKSRNDFIEGTYEDIDDDNDRKI